MTTQELAYTEIERLVTNFKSMPASQRKGMNEMQTRHRLRSLVRVLRDKKQINRRIDFGNPVEKSAHDEIVRLVERMLALQEEHQSVRREDDLDRVRNLERQIAHVDAKIDQRVYAVYGLTEEEIKIVEGG
jgi:hypothetical protein